MEIFAIRKAMNNNIIYKKFVVNFITNSISVYPSIPKQLYSSVCCAYANGGIMISLHDRRVPVIVLDHITGRNSIDVNQREKKNCSTYKRNRINKNRRISMYVRNIKCIHHYAWIDNLRSCN